MLENWKKTLKESVKENTNLPSFNMLSNTAAVKGDIFIDGDFRFDGKMNGNLECNGKLILGSSSYIEGEVICKDAEISGKVKGNIKSKGLIILRDKSKIDGDVISGKLMVEIGAIVSMKCHTNPDNENETQDIKPEIKNEEIKKEEVSEKVDFSGSDILKDLIKNSEEFGKVELIKKTRKRTKKSTENNNENPVN